VLGRCAGREVALRAEPFGASRLPNRAGFTAGQLAAWYERHEFRMAGTRRPA
jgi:hypothetical protein